AGRWTGRRSARPCTATSAAALATGRSSRRSRRPAMSWPRRSRERPGGSAGQGGRAKRGAPAAGPPRPGREDRPDDTRSRGRRGAGLVRWPVPSAGMVRRNAAEALKVAGVVAVLFGEDVPHNEVWVDVPGQTIEVAPLKANMEILATGRVRFQGEPVALVIA